MSASNSPTKTQFYSANGAGRDSYIYSTNGGFCPPKEPCKIEALGKSVHSTLRLSQSPLLSLMQLLREDFLIGVFFPTLIFQVA